MGGLAGSPGGLVTYSFNPASNWMAVEKAAFVATLHLWQAEAGVSFTQVDSGGLLTLTRGTDGAYTSYSLYPATIGSTTLASTGRPNTAAGWCTR